MPDKPEFKEEALEALTAEPAKEELEDFVRDLRANVEQAHHDRNVWAKDCADYYLWEQGMVGKPDPDKPFVGSSDIRFRTSAEYIRKAKPSFVESVCEAPHVVRFIGGGEADSRQEQFNDWQYRGRTMDFASTVNAAAHRLLGPFGMCILKVTFDYRKESSTKTDPKNEMLKVLVKQTPDAAAMQVIANANGYNLSEPAGKAKAKEVLRQLKDDSVDIVTRIVEREVKNCPSITECNPLDIIVPWYCPADIQKSPWVAHRMIYDHRTLRSEGECKGYKNVESIIERVKTADEDEQKEMLRRYENIAQGLDTTLDFGDSVPILEWHGWIPRSWIDRFNDKDGDESDEDMVRGIIALCPLVAGKEGVLRVIEYPYDYEGLFSWGFVDIRHNDSGTGFYCGEGIPKLNNPYEQEFNVSTNGGIDRSTIINSPPRFWSKRSFGGSNPRERQRTVGGDYDVFGDPSQAFYVPQMPDIASPMHIDAQRMEQRAKGLIGVQDVSSMPAYDRPPTKGQIEATLSPSNAIQRRELKNWLDGWSRVFTMAHLINKQWLFYGENVQAKTFADATTGAKQHISQADFMPEYIIRAGGDANRMDENIELQKFTAWFSQMVNNPAHAYALEIDEARRIYTYKMIGAVYAQKVLASPQKAAANQEKFMAMQAQAAAAAEANKKKRDGGAGGKPPMQPGGANPGTLNIPA